MTTRRQSLSFFAKLVAASTAFAASVPLASKPDTYLITFSGRNADDRAKNDLLYFLRQLDYQVEKIS